MYYKVFANESVLQMCVLLDDMKQLSELLDNKSIDLNNKMYCIEIMGELVCGVTALHTAVVVNNIIAAKMLLQSGADVNALTEFAMKGRVQQKRRHSSLHIAVRNENQEMVQLLVQSGADLNIEDETGDTPLEYAIHLGPQIVALLVSGGADTERFNFHPNKVALIFRAISLNNNQLVRLFGKMQTKCVYHINESPIEYAMSVFPNCVEFLIECGTGLHIQNLKTGDTLLHVAVRKKNHSWVQLLLEKGLNPNIENYIGNRPLHIAVINKCNRIVVLSLLSSGADINFRNKKDLSPLYYAIENGDIYLTETLFRYGSKVSPQLHELETAIRCRQYKTGLILLENCQTSLSSVEFHRDPVVMHLLRHCVGDNTSDVNDMVAFLEKLIECGAQLNTIDSIWGTLLHFLIYAMVCVPNTRYRPLFTALISSPECDINKVFIPKNTLSKKGEVIEKEQIQAYGTPLSFALQLADCEFFAEELIQMGADVNSIVWEYFWFAPNKVRALKMLFYSGCQFPEDFHNLFDPQYYQLEEDEDPNSMEEYVKAFAEFNHWLDLKQSSPWSLKNMSRLAMRKRFGSQLPKESIQFMRFESDLDF